MAARVAVSATLLTLWYGAGSLGGSTAREKGRTMKMRYMGLCALAAVATVVPVGMATAKPPFPVPPKGPPIGPQAATTTTSSTTTTTTQPASGPWDPVTDPDMLGVSCSVVLGRKTAVLLFQAPVTDTADYTVQVDRLDGDPLSVTTAWPYLGLNGVPNGRGQTYFTMDWPLTPDGLPATAMQFTIFDALGVPIVHEQHTWFEVDAQEPSCSAVWGAVG